MLVIDILIITINAVAGLLFLIAGWPCRTTRNLEREELGYSFQVPVTTVRYFMCIISFKPPNNLVASFLSEWYSLELCDFRVMLVG